MGNSLLMGLVFLTQNEMAGDDCQNTGNSSTRQGENLLVTTQGKLDKDLLLEGMD